MLHSALLVRLTRLVDALVVRVQRDYGKRGGRRTQPAPLGDAAVILKMLRLSYALDKKADVASVSWTARALRSATNARNREREQDRKQDRKQNKDQNVGVVGSGGGSSSSNNNDNSRLTSNY
ncbi:hypothetical protein F5Y07DRAFT_404876 [Xylaria sp. FL0933]|nr:hypothetical protein F5Y07DRAFT_404876 [Xylaria sp. FL0933]